MFTAILFIACVHASLFPTYSDAHLTLHNDAYPQKLFDNRAQGNLRIQKPYTPYLMRNQKHYCPHHNKKPEKNEKQKRILAYHQELGFLERELASVHTKKAYHYDRLKAIKAVLKKKSSPHKLPKLPPQPQSFLQQYGIIKTHISYPKMNAYELQLHREYLDQLNHVIQFAHIRDEIPEYQIFIDVVGYGVSCGIQANNDHQVMQATLWADFGWKTLSIASAVAQGILSGTKNAVTSVVNIVRHPIETIQNFGHGISMLGVLIGKTYAHLIRCELALERGDDNDLQAQVQQTVAITNAVIAHCSHELSQIPVEDKLKHSVAIATEFIVTPYIFKSIHALCSKVKPVAAGIMHALQDEQNIERFNNSSLGQVAKTVQQAVERGVEKVKEVAKVGLGPLIPEIANSYEYIVAAVNNVEPNKIHHILTLETKKHAWHKIIEGEITWEKVKNVIKKVMMEGEISPRDPIFKKSLLIYNETVEVVFAPRSNNTISIVDAWVKTI